MKRVSIAVLLLILIVGGAWYAYVAFSTDDDTPDTPLAQIPLTFDDQIAMANLACDGHASVNEKKIIACKTCPIGSDFAGENSGSDAGWWSNTGVLTGSFTAPGMDEALMRAAGCDSHANNRSGDFLFRREGSKWSLVRYAKGATADETCLKSIWGDGRDAVICQTSDMHQGIASDAVQLMTFDTAQPSPLIDQELYRKVNFVVTEDGSGNCGFPLGDQQTLQFDKVDRAYLVPTNTNRPSVIVKVTLARAKSGKAGVDTCPAAQPESYTVTWKNLGDHFEAAEGYVGLAARAQDPCCDLMVASRVEPIHY